MILSAEKIKIVRQAKSVNELLQLARKNGFELSESVADRLFSHLQGAGELTDEQLGSVSGGKNWCCIYPMYANPEDVQYRFPIGARVEVVTSVGFITDHVYTSGATVVNRMANNDSEHSSCYVAYYLLSGGDYSGMWLPEYALEHGYDLIINVGL